VSASSPTRPRILVTNDDGYDAPGLRALVEMLEPLGDLVVAAPDREQSGSSHALTLELPLRVTRVGDGRFRISGTPTDCVHLAVFSLTGGRLPDLVVSGINRGLNVGDDVIYSGTVAGAMEGALLHVPSLALSAAIDERGNVDYARHGEFVRGLVTQLLERGLGDGVLLNVNFPATAPRGVRVTRQGTRRYRATAVERVDPSGRPYFWIAGADVAPTGEPDGDHRAIAEQRISVTPLHTDLTHAPTRDRLGEWGLGEG